MNKLYTFAKNHGWTRTMALLGKHCGLTQWEIMADIEAARARCR